MIPGKSPLGLEPIGAKYHDDVSLLEDVFNTGTEGQINLAKLDPNRALTQIVLPITYPTQVKDRGPGAVTEI